MGDDPKCTLHRDADAGGAGARLGDQHPSLEDNILGFEELSGDTDASRQGLHLSGKAFPSYFLLRHPFLHSGLHLGCHLLTVDGRFQVRPAP